MVYVPTCLHASVVYVPTCLHANVPKACQFLIFMCQCANKGANVPYNMPFFFNLVFQQDKWCANFSTWHANVPKDMPSFQIVLLQNAKGNFYTLLLYKKFYILLDITVKYICICWWWLCAWATLWCLLFCATSQKVFHFYLIRLEKFKNYFLLRLQDVTWATHGTCT